MATGIGWLILAGWMVWDSKVGKLWARDRLLDGLALRGDETVLDLSGNRPEATLQNARLEGVAERVEVKDGADPPAPVRRRHLRRDRHERGAPQHL
jgi:hypothetical protein